MCLWDSTDRSRKQSLSVPWHIVLTVCPFQTQLIQKVFFFFFEKFKTPKVYIYFALPNFELLQWCKPPPRTPQTVCSSSKSTNHRLDDGRAHCNFILRLTAPQVQLVPTLVHTTNELHGCYIDVFCWCCKNIFKILFFIYIYILYNRDF
jgi:hypothetical protein